ncbi:MAG: efflux RND transporter permease subunit, partial [Mucilaginibacter sp.]|nr:efflux RND transporter permease subunit [Mucilaginibacter sp.]
GSLLREFSLVVVFSTLMSLFVSFTITPMLASRFGKIEKLSKDTLWGRLNLGFEHLIDMLRNSYGRALEVVQRKKRWLLSGITILIIASFALIPAGFIGAAFIPSTDKGELLVTLELAPSASIFQTNAVTQQVEKIILKKPEVKNVFSSVGFVTGGVTGAGNTANLAELNVTIVDKTQRKETDEQFGLRLQRELSVAIPGVKITAVPAASGAQSPIQIAVKAVDIKDARQVAEAYMQVARKVPGTQFVKLSVKDPKPQVEIKLDREKMASFGLNAGQVGAALQNAFSGNDQSKFKQAGKEYDILISFKATDRSDINNVRNLPFTNGDGQTFVLSQFADVKEGLGESVLERNNRLNSITVNANVAGRPVGTVTAEIKDAAKKLNIPKGVIVEFLGDAKNQGDAFGSLGLALVTAILLVYLIMVALYESLIYPFVVLFSIPVAVVGALLALALSMETLNIFSFIGLIMLLGLVSKNAILIVDFTNQLKEEGRPVEDALIEAGRERLRPILMTTLAMILGMLPIALATGAGAEIKSGMAWVIIGGLTSSMVFTVFVVPAMYLIIEKIKNRFQRSGAPSLKPVGTS